MCQSEHASLKMSLKEAFYKYPLPNTWQNKQKTEEELIKKH